MERLSAGAGHGRPGDPGEAARRIRRVRRASIAGALATLGVFSGLAAAGDPDHDSSSPVGPSAPAARSAPDRAGSPASRPEDGDPGRDGGYFDPYDGSRMGPGTPSGPPDAVSGAS